MAGAGRRSSTKRAGGWLVVVLATASGGCNSSPLQPVPVDAASSEAPVVVPLRLAAGDQEVCAFEPMRAFCIGGPDRRGAPFSVRSGPPGTVEVIGACYRTTAGVARCQGVEAAADVASLEGAPYARRTDGSVLALDVDDGPGHVSAYEARRVVAAALGSVKKVVHGAHAGCALRGDDTVACWTEPWTLGPSKAAPRIRPVPGVADAVDVFLYAWLQLCVRDRAGTVRCSAPPPPQATDPADLLARPLVTVTTGATAMAPFRWPPAESLDLAQQRELADVDPGGCATRAGDVVCWNRSPCGGRKWTTTPVVGMPLGARVVLGAHHGYGLGKDGALYTFPRRDVRPVQRGDDARCQDEAAFAPPTIHATPMPLPPVHDVAGGTVRVPEPPGYAAADCASLRDGSVWCWTASDTEPLGAPMRVPLP